MIALALGVVLGGPISPEVIASVRRSVAEACAYTPGTLALALEGASTRPARLSAPASPSTVGSAVDEVSVATEPHSVPWPEPGDHAPERRTFEHYPPDPSEEAIAMIRQRMAALRHCYERALHGPPTGSRRFELNVVTHDRQIRAELTPPAPPELAETAHCIEAQARSWPWPLEFDVRIPLLLLGRD